VAINNEMDEALRRGRTAREESRESERKRKRKKGRGEGAAVLFSITGKPRIEREE